MSLRPAETAQPLHFWRADQLRELDRLLEMALLSWAGDWGLAQSLVRVSCHRAGADDAATDGIALRGQEGMLAHFRSETWAAALVRELFGAAIDPCGIPGEVAGACIDDAMRRLAHVLGMPGARRERTPPPRLRRGTWRGEVQAALPFGGVLLLNAAAAEACLRRRGMAARPRRSLPADAPVAMPLLRAAAGQRVSLRAQLEPCEVDLGVLQDLRPGDVLRIPHRLDAPLQLRTEAGTALFSGYLANSRGRKVLELVAPA